MLSLSESIPSLVVIGPPVTYIFLAIKDFPDEKSPFNVTLTEVVLLKQGEVTLKQKGLQAKA